MEDIWQMYLEGVKKAAKRAFFVREDTLEEEMFSLWSEMIHDILLKHHCPCIDNNDGECFLNQPKERQIELLSKKGRLSFGDFYGIMKSMRKEFFSILFESFTDSNVVNEEIIVDPRAAWPLAHKGRLQ